MTTDAKGKTAKDLDAIDQEVKRMPENPVRAVLEKIVAALRDIAQRLEDRLPHPEQPIAPTPPVGVPPGTTNPPTTPPA